MHTENLRRAQRRTGWVSFPAVLLGWSPPAVEPGVCEQWLCRVFATVPLTFSHKRKLQNKDTRAMCCIYNTARVAGTYALTWVDNSCYADHKLIHTFTLLTSKYIQNADEHLGHCFPTVYFGCLHISVWVWIRRVLFKQISEWCPANVV